MRKIKRKELCLLCGGYTILSHHQKGLVLCDLEDYIFLEASHETQDVLARALIMNEIP